MYFANYSKSKHMSVGKVCIKRFEFACMTILSPETVPIVLCQCSIMDMQVPPVPKQPKTAEILAQNALKTHIEATINQKFSRGRSPNPPYKRGIHLVLSPLLIPLALTLTSAVTLLNTCRRA